MKIWLRIALFVGSAAILASTFVLVRARYRNRPLSLTGAVIQQSDDPRKESPIPDVEVTITGEQATTSDKANLPGYLKIPLRPAVGHREPVAEEPLAASTKTNMTGYFRLELPRRVRPGQNITLRFRNPKYQPLDLNTTVGNELYVIHMVPLQPDDQTPSDRIEVVVNHVLIRYSIETGAEVNVGTGLITFQVPNKGGVPCDKKGPCSPDSKWKAAIGSGSLDAGHGNVFRNARLFCIAGPCPFTKIESDEFSRGGQNISASVRNWSDTTTFLFEAEVFRQQVSNIVRESYPVIFGRTFNFSLPASAEGTSLEAELDRTPIIFPLPPDPNLSWAACKVLFGSHSSKSYRCELKPGYKFP
jgi:hypothetical protein